MKEQEEELIRRAKLSKQAGTMGKSYGESYPYETLNITNDATSKNIRRAYRHLTLLLHPDKNPASLREMALNAFRDIVSAYEVIGTQQQLINKNKLLKENYEGFSLSVDLNRSKKEQVLESLKKAIREIQKGRNLIT